jgi:uncharacterized protein (DUF488 family)
MPMINLFTIGFCGKKEAEFYDLLDHAGVKVLVDIRLLLCSEKNPEMCHRRLVTEYLADKFVGVEIRHL